MAPGAAKPVVLICEDEIIIAADLESRLTNMGYTVCGIALSGPEAVRLAEAHEPDLVIMDIVLQGEMDGIQAAEAIRDKWAVPVVFLTAYADASRLRRARLVYPFGYILKPFQERDLKITVEMALYASQTDRRRREAEAALRAREAALRSILRAAPVGIGVVCDRVIQDVNDRFCEMTGYSADELIGLSSQILYPSKEEYDHVGREKYRQILATGEGAVETRFMRKDGEIIDVLLSSSPIDPQDLAKGVTFTALDITDRKQMEKALLESRARFSQMFEHMSSGVAIYQAVDDGADFVFNAFNSAAERITRVSRDQVLGNRLLDCFPHMEKSGLIDALKRVWKTGQPEHLAPFHYRDDLREGWRENQIYRLPSTEVVAIFDDVTERMKAEGALRESEEKYRAIVDNSGEGVAIFIDDPHPVAYVNPSITEIFEYSVEELLSMEAQKVFSLIHPEDRSFALDRFQRRLAGEDPVNRYAYRIIAKSGAVKWVELYAQAITYQGRRATLAGYKDITKQKNDEQELLKGSREKETLLKELHHRVKNNMQVIISLMNLQSNALENVSLKNVFLESQTRIYAMSAVHETLHQSGSLAHVDLAAYLTKLSEAAFQTYGPDDGRVEITMDIQPIQIQLERSYPIGIVVNELLSNAMKYAFPENRPGAVSIIGDWVDDMVRLVVSDDGVGFPPGVDWRRTDSLGLQLVKTLVEGQLGGRIDLDDAEGATWEIRFNA